MFDRAKISATLAKIQDFRKVFLKVAVSVLGCAYKCVLDGFTNNFGN